MNIDETMLILFFLSPRLVAGSLCMGPKAKTSVLKKYNMSTRALDEPNIKEIKTLMKLNKTIKDLFLETTYKLDIDFILNITFIYYGKEGEKRDQKELHLGKDVFQVWNMDNGYVMRAENQRSGQCLAFWAGLQTASAES